MSEQQQPASPPANRLYVGNIPWSTTVEELQALFADATSVEIPTVRRRFRRLLLFRCGALVFFDDKKRALVSAMNESARWRSNRDSIVRDADSFGVSLASNIGAGLKRSATPSRRTQTRGARRDDDDGKSTSEEKEASRRVDQAWWGKRKRGLCEHYATPSSSRKRDRESPFFSGSFLTFLKGSRKKKEQKGEKAALF